MRAFPDQVDFVAALRAMLRCPDTAAPVDGETLRIPEASRKLGDFAALKIYLQQAAEISRQTHLGFARCVIDLCETEIPDGQQERCLVQQSQPPTRQVAFEVICVSLQIDAGLRQIGLPERGGYRGDFAVKADGRFRNAEADIAALFIIDMMGNMEPGVPIPDRRKENTGYAEPVPVEIWHLPGRAGCKPGEIHGYGFRQVAGLHVVQVEIPDLAQCGDEDKCLACCCDAAAGGYPAGDLGCVIIADRDFRDRQRQKAGFDRVVADPRLGGQFRWQQSRQRCLTFPAMPV